MIKYAKIINKETKECSVGLGNNIIFYKSLGMVEMDVEKSINGRWYAKGSVPQKTPEEILAEKRKIRNGYLADSDKYMLQDFPITSSEKNKWKEYRVYLRDFFNDETYALNNDVKTFDEYFPK